MNVHLSSWRITAIVKDNLIVSKYIPLVPAKLKALSPQTYIILRSI